MRKKISLCAALLLLFAAGLTLVGCKQPEPSEQVSEFYTIAEFETVEELRSMNYLNSFGKASLNTDSQFLTGGEHSIRLEIHGNYSEGPVYYPTLWVYSSNPYNPLNKIDFTDVDYFSFDLYNASDRDLEVSFGYSYQVSMSSAHSPRTLLTLKKGQWNHFNIPLVREAAAQGFQIQQIDTFMFVFENPEKEETKPVVYLDRFLAHKADTPMGSYQKNRSENEIFGFNELLDVQSMYVSGVYSHFYGNAMLDLNRDARYIAEGNGSLRVVNKPFQKHPYGDYNDSPTIGFGGDSLKAIQDFSQYEAIRFSIFNASDRNWDWSFYVRDEQGAGFAKYGLTAPKGQWTEFEIPMSEIAKGTGVVNGQTVSMDLTKIANISWAYNGFMEGSDLVFYLDNVAFVPKGENV